MTYGNRNDGNCSGLPFVKYKTHGGTFGVPVASRHKQKERHQDEQGSDSDPGHLIAALFEQSGEIAPVDFRRFGMRAGEIIARATRAPNRKLH